MAWSRSVQWLLVGLLATIFLPLSCATSDTPVCLMKNEPNKHRFCLALKDPPFIRHGKFRSKDLMRHYPFSPRFFNSLSPPLSFVGLQPVLSQLAFGGNVNIVLLGGSMPLGHSCSQKLESFVGGGLVTMTECAWSARFVEWLRITFPLARITLRNLAVGGMPASYFAADVSRFVNNQTNLVILDTFVNDVAGSPQNAVAEENLATTDIAASLESLILALTKTFPDVVLLDTLLIPDWAIGYSQPVFYATRRAHEIVMRHYGIPLFHLTEIIANNSATWPTIPNVNHNDHWTFDALQKVGPPKRPLVDDFKLRQNRFDNLVHPHWSTHQLISDVLGNLVAKTWLHLLERNKTGPIQNKQRHAIKPLSSPDALAAFSGCPRSLSVWSADDMYDWAVRDLPFSTGNWMLVEEAKGKRGWIANQSGSEIFFPVSFGENPKLSITFLKSYHKAGKVTLSLNESNIPLASFTGKWVQQYSQGVTVVLHSRVKTFKGLAGVQPNSNATVRVRLENDRKFKVIRIVSC